MGEIAGDGENMIKTFFSLKFEMMVYAGKVTGTIRNETKLTFIK